MRTVLQIIKRSSKLSSLSSLGVLREDGTLEESVNKESGFSLEDSVYVESFFNLKNSKDLLLTFLTPFCFWLSYTMFLSIIASLELTESLLTCLKTVA